MLARCRWAALPFSADGAPAELRCRCAVLLVLAVPRSGGARPSLAGGRVAAAPGVEANKGFGDVAEQDDGVGGAGWRLFGAEVRRLPVRGGAPPNPRRLWRSDGGAPSACAVRRRRRGVSEGPSCNFAFVLVLSVRDLF